MNPQFVDSEEVQRGLTPASLGLASMMVQIQTPAAVGKEDIWAFMGGVGELLSKRPGFRSRKVLETVPGADSGRVFIVINKFQGVENMISWSKSPELAALLSKGAEELGLKYSVSLSSSPALQINLGVLTGGENATLSAVPAKKPSGPPPKYKLFIIIEFYVFLCIVAAAGAMTFPKIDAAIGGDVAFSLLLLLSAVVPVIVYSALPLSFSVALFRAWVFVRKTPPPQWEPLRTLDRGLMLFVPLPVPNVSQPAFVRQVGKLEARVEALKLLVIDQHCELSQLRKASSSAGPNPQGVAEEQQLLDKGELGWVEGGWGESPKAFSPDVLKKIKAENSVKLAGELYSGAESKLEMVQKLHMENGDFEEISVVAKHVVKWECTAQFEEWSIVMSDAMEAYLGVYFLGLDVFHRSYKLGASAFPKSDEESGATALDSHNEKDETGTSQFIVIFRVASRETMEEWLSSKERTMVFAKAKAWQGAASTFSHTKLNQELLGGTGTLTKTIDVFGLLLLGDAHDHEDHVGALPPVQPPPLYRTCILTTLGLFLVAWPVVSKLQPVLVEKGFPLTLILLITTSINVFLNTYFGAPFMNFLFGGWLQQPRAKHPGPIMLVLTNGFPDNKGRLALLAVYFVPLLVMAIVNGQ